MTPKPTTSGAIRRKEKSVPKAACTTHTVSIHTGAALEIWLPCANYNYGTLNFIGLHG